MSSRFFWPLVGLLCIGAAVAGYRLAGERHNPAVQLTGGTWLPRARPLVSVHLTDSHGRPFTRADLEGRVSLMYFGYSHCPDECPDTLALLARVRRAVSMPRLQVLFVSIDPRRDTPPVLAGYLRQFDPAFLGLTGQPDQLRRLAASLGVAFGASTLPGGDETFDHTMALFLFDTRAREVAVFTPPFNARALAAALRRVAPRLSAA